MAIDGLAVQQRTPREVRAVHGFERHVVRRGEPRGQPHAEPALGHVHEALADASGHGHPGDVLPVQFDRPARRLAQSRQPQRQLVLPVACHARHPQHLAGVQCECDAAERLQTPVVDHAQIACGQNHLSGAGAVPALRRRQVSTDHQAGQAARGHLPDVDAVPDHTPIAQHRHTVGGLLDLAQLV